MVSITTILLTIGLLALGFAGIAIKILVQKDGEFAGTCSSNNPLLDNEDGSCSICGPAGATAARRKNCPKAPDQRGCDTASNPGVAHTAYPPCPSSDINRTSTPKSG